MKLSISSIGWDWSDTARLLPRFRDAGVTGIEVAPTTAWQNWDGASPSAAVELRHFLEDHGFKVPALQAILFGQPQLQVFNRATWPLFLDHLKLVSSIAASLEAPVLVFGAPKNRLRGLIPYNQAEKLAVEFFQQAGETMADEGVIIGLEPNPVAYGCDFLTNPGDVRHLVGLVQHPNVQLHFDTGAILLSAGRIEREILHQADFAHYHISAPNLDPLLSFDEEHRQASLALENANYQGWVSIEMRKPADEETLFKSILNAKRWYTNAS